MGAGAGASACLRKQPSEQLPAYTRRSCSSEEMVTGIGPTGDASPTQPGEHQVECWPSKVIHSLRLHTPLLKSSGHSPIWQAKCAVLRSTDEQVDGPGIAHRKGNGARRQGFSNGLHTVSGALGLTWT